MPFKIKKTVSSLAPSGNSVLFNGSNQYLSTPTNAAYVFGTGDFTVEAWIKLDSTSTNGKRIVGLGYGANGTGPVTCTWELRYLGTDGSGQITIYRYDGIGGEIVFSTTGATLTAGTWYHIAASRSSGTLKIFVNGVSYYSAANSTNFSLVNNDPLLVGLAYYGPASGMNGPRYFGGAITNLRIVNGTAVYTSNFTPSTSPLTAIANTSLLTCNAATIIDGSTNNFTITNNNAATVSSAVTPFSSTFSPFKIKKNDVNLTSGFKLKHVSYVRPVYDFTISPAYSGKSTWDLTADGPLILSTSGSWIITPANLINTKIKMWGGGGASFKAAWKGGGGGFSSGSVQLEPGVPYRIVTSMNGSNGIIGSGGLTGIFSSSISQANSIMIAGGGGIGTDYIGSYGGDGGAGGGSSGQDGTGNGLQNGRGGTQIAGGSPAIYNGVPAGSALQANGGDGGAGYWGGGAQNAAGSGGGSGYIHPTKVVNGTTVTGASSTPANSSDSERSGSAQGSLGNTPGSMGIIIIRAA